MVTLTGANFTGASVLLDRGAVTPLSQSDTQIRLQMPRHDNGYVVIHVQNASGKAHGEFLYIPPRLDEIRPGDITTVAGVGKYDHAYGPATEAMINANGFVFDDAGNTYFTDANANRIYVVHADGTIEPFAGSGAPIGPAGDGGLALDAVISFPKSMALDGAGNVYVPDANSRIRRIDANGVISTIAGTGIRGYSGDGGPALAAKINSPSYVAADREDVFFIDSSNNRLRRIHLADGMISTIAGDGTAGFSGDGGPSIFARFNEASPDDGALLLDAAGNIYLLDARNGRIRRIDRQSGIIDTVLVVRDSHGNIIDNLTAFALDRAGNFYYSYGGFIAEAGPAGATIAEWGHRDGAFGFSSDGTPAATAQYAQVNFLGIDRNDNIVFDDSSVGRLRRINRATGKLETVAGMSPAIYAENGPATAAVLVTSDGADLAMHPSGDLLIADTWNYRLRRLAKSGNLTTIAGNGMTDLADGPIDATHTGVVPLAVHADAGGIDITAFGRISRMDPNGTLRAITRFIGGGGICQYSGDGGPAINSGICQPWDTARDRAGNLYIADTNNNRIRRVDAATGVITTIAGNGGPRNGFEHYGNGTYCGDGGPALNACLNTPYGMVIDNDGNMFISEFHSRVRKIDPSGVISTYATFPSTKLRVDAAGSLFAVGRDGVVRFDRYGTLTVLAGNGTDGFSGDGGPARLAQFGSWGESEGLAIDGEGNLFFTDVANYRVRAIRYGAFLAAPGATITATKIGSGIRASVMNANGRPAPSVRVDFTAPGSGASCALSSPFAITDANGVATVSCTSNCVEGTYNVVAQPLTASATASVSFSNVAGGPCRRHAVRH